MPSSPIRGFPVCVRRVTAAPRDQQEDQVTDAEIKLPCVCVCYGHSEGLVPNGPSVNMSDNYPTQFTLVSKMPLTCWNEAAGPAAH